MTIENTVWGITQISKRPAQSPPLVEVDSWDPHPCGPGSQVVLRFSHWYLSATEASDHYEREQILFDLMTTIGAQAGALTVTERLLDDPALPKKVTSLLLQSKAKGLSLYFDCGRAGHPPWLEPEFCVFDPLWFSTKPWSSYWKVHGWHPERWVRRYSEADLSKLVEMARRFSPKFLILGHSQRLEQWHRIRQMI